MKLYRVNVYDKGYVGVQWAMSKTEARRMLRLRLLELKATRDAATYRAIVDNPANGVREVAIDVRRDKLLEWLNANFTIAHAFALDVPKIASKTA